MFHRTTAAAASLLLAAAPAVAQENTKLTFDHAVSFGAGTPQMRAGLQTSDATREIVKAQFGVAAEDLNGDGAAEIILLSMSPDACNAAACKAVILEKRGAEMVPIFAASLAMQLGVSRESVGGYRALIAHDGKGGVVTAGNGQQVVYRIGAGGAASASANAAPAAGGGAASAPAASAASSDPRAEVLGLKLGMSLADARAVLQAHKPPFVESKGAPPLPVPGIPDSGFTTVVSAMDTSDLAAITSLTLSFSPPPTASRLIGIIRGTGYKPEAAITIENLRAAVKEKYGAPHSTIPTNGVYSPETLTWSWSPAGAPLPEASQKKCGDIAAYLAGDQLRQILLPSGRGLLGMEEYQKSLVASGCGLVVRVIFTPQGTTLVNHLDVSVADVGAVADTLGRAAQVSRANAEREDQRLRDAASARKPAL